MTIDNPLVDDVSIVTIALQSRSVDLNHPGAGAAFHRIVDALRRSGLYHYPGEEQQNIGGRKRRMRLK